MGEKTDLTRHIMDALDLPADVPETRHEQQQITAALSAWPLLSREESAVLLAEFGDSSPYVVAVAESYGYLKTQGVLDKLRERVEGAVQ